MNRMPSWVWGSAALAALLSLFGLYFRHKAEAANKAVGLVVEADVVSELSSASGVSFEIGLRTLKEAGITGVSFNEETGSQLISDGRLKVEMYGQKAVLSGEAAMPFRQVLEERRGDDSRLSDMSMIEGVSPEFLHTTSFGINSLESSFARNAGLEIIARYGNTAGLKERYLKWLWKDAADKGAKWFLPSGDEMLGRNSLTDESIAQMEAYGITFLTAEFVKLAGDSQVRSEYKDHTLRLHAIPPPEISRMPESAVLERYSKAWRERQIRWLMVRPYGLASEDPINDFAAHIRKVRAEINEHGGAVRVPRPFTEPGTPRPLFPLIMLACVPAMAWLASVFIPNRRTLPIAAVLLGLGALACWSEGVRNEFALLVGIAMPVVGFAWLFRREKPVHPLLGFLGITAFSLTAGLIIASTLVGVSYTLQNVQFSGIKIAHFMPMLLVGLLALQTRLDLKKVMKEPVLWGTVLLSFVAMAAVGFMLIRSGNESPGAVSGLELKFRSLLEGALYTRPRTKEFMIGHPALIIGLALMWIGANRRPHLWTAGAMLTVLGVIGQASMVNTLCHLHTPVIISLIRIMIGLVLGGIIGAACWGALKLVLRSPREIST